MSSGEKTTTTPTTTPASTATGLRIRPRHAAAFETRVESFTKDLASAVARTRSLLGPRSHPLDQHPDLLREALEELRIQHEELLVAEDELRAQLDELRTMGIRLRTERERYAQLFHRAPDPYIVTDRHGTIREANAAAAKAFSVEDPRTLRSRPLTNWISSHDLPIIQATLQSLEPHAPTTFVDVSIRRGKMDADLRFAARISASDVDHVLWVLREPEQGDSIPDPLTPPSSNVDAGTPSSGGGTTTTTGESGLARALRDKEDLLQREKRARRDLERANRAKDKFIAVLSHDLRSPLNAILGWTQILRREILDHTARDRAFETIERNARTQAKMIEELLDISRVAADRVQLALETVDIGALVQRIHHGALPDAEKANVALLCHIEDEGEGGKQPLMVIGDRQRLEQVLGNLISNALKHTPEAGRIDLRVKRSSEQEGRVDIIVTDTGHGISPKLLPHIFDMYVQDQTLASSRSGLGIGLYIVKQLVELHDGTVAAESEGEGKGASFRVTLPLQPESSSELLSAVGTGTGGSARVPSPLSEMTISGTSDLLRYVRVLVVDDEEDSRELMAMILRRAGAHVACASDLHDAIRVFDAFGPDVVVSDLAMPGGDGCELMTALRARDPRVTGMVVSGYTNEPEVERALNSGFDVHVGKPIDANVLIEAVEEAVRLRANS